MNKLISNLPKLSMYLLLAVSVVVTVMFWVGGGSDVEINGEVWNEPAYTGLYLNWTYVLCIVAIFLTLIISLVQFCASFVANPKKGIVTLVVLIVFAGVFIVSWMLGSDEKLNIIGYEGTDNVGVMARYTDMCLYVVYVLFAAIIVTLFGTAVYSKLK